MNYARDQHSIVYHYADGVSDILGLSTAQQLAIRTAMHLALRELATGYEATAADMATQIELLRNELQEAAQSQEQALSAQLAPLLAHVKTSEPATIHRNGTHPAPAVLAAVKAAHAITQEAFDAEAAHESAAPEAQMDPTPAPSKPGDRKPFPFSWGMLDDQSRQIAGSLDEGKYAWRVLSSEDKRIIALTVIKELQLDMAPGETLDIAQFDNRRPIWMPSFPSLSTSLGMTWKQMLAAAAD